MTIEKQMKREDLIALIRERERKERIRDAAEDLLEASKASHTLAVGMGKLAVEVAGQGRMFSPGVVKDLASKFIRATKVAIDKAEGREEPT